MSIEIIACGIGTVAAREKVRVARALESLPEISTAFARREVAELQPAD